MKKLICTLMLSVLLLSLSSCAKKQTESTDTSVPAPSEFMSLTDIREGRPDVYLIVKLIDSGYWQVLIQGAKDAGDQFDCNVYYAGTGIETDWQGQRLLIKEAMERGADAIVLSPDDSVELAPDIETIHESSIPVVLVDTAANTEEYDICYMTDNLYAGQKAAEEMLRQLRESGHEIKDSLNVGIMVGSATSQTINERLAGFYQYWSVYAPIKWTIISDIQNCNGDAVYGETLAEKMLQEHPDLAGVYGTNNGPTKALCKVINANERKDVVVVGFDYSDEMKALIESDDYNASTMLQRQYDMAYKGVGSALELLSGEKTATRFEDTGVVVVNKESLSDPDVAEVLQHN